MASFRNTMTSPINFELKSKCNMDQKASLERLPTATFLPGLKNISSKQFQHNVEIPAQMTETLTSEDRV